MPKFRKKPVVIEAMQYTGDNGFECVKFIGVGGTKEQDGELSINTLEGVMHVSKWDWIIKGVEGEKYPCKPDIFAKTYEEVGVDRGPDLSRTETEKEVEGRIPRLFYYDEGEGRWIPVSNERAIYDTLDIGLDQFSKDGEEIEIRLKRVDLTDEEFTHLPEY